MKLIVKRFKNLPDATIGSFSLFDDEKKEIVTGYTLEPSGPDTITPNQDKRIPAGKYSAIWSYSPTFKRKLPLLFNEKVSEQRRILIHTGNYGKDTSGCIIVGSTLGKNAVFNSIKKFKELEAILKFQDFTVEIKNVGV